MVVGLGKKNVDSDTEMNEEDQKSGNLRQASGGKALSFLRSVNNKAASNFH